MDIREIKITFFVCLHALLNEYSLSSCTKFCTQLRSMSCVVFLKKRGSWCTILEMCKF